jgi:hypothetical protein
MIARQKTWMLPLAFVAALTLSACEDTNDPPPEPEIDAMRIVVSPTGAASQTVTVAKDGCVRTGNPITLALNTTTPIAISFLGEDGQPHDEANDPAIFTAAGATPQAGGSPAAEPAPTPASIVWARTGSFAGTLRGSAATTTGSVTISALHIEEGHADFECAVAITVQ